MMKSKFLVLLTFLIGFTGCDPATLQQTIDSALGSSAPLTQSQIGGGLKEALNLGVAKGVDVLSQQNGFLQSPYKVLLPEEAQNLVSKLRNVPGFGNIEQELVKKINGACEDAVVKAKPIFVNAIKQMTFQDATNILMGQKNAATGFLKDKTSQQIANEFKPDIVNSLNKFGALDLWTKAVNSYNSIPLVKKMNPQLEDHITNKAMDGLFQMVEKKESEIRTNTSARTSDLLRRVFAKQD